MTARSESRETSSSSVVDDKVPLKKKMFNDDMLSMTRKGVYSETLQDYDHGDDKDIYGLFRQDDAKKERIKGGRGTPSQETSVTHSLVINSRLFCRKTRKIKSYNIKLLKKMKSIIVLSVIAIILMSCLVCCQEVSKCKKRESVPDCVPSRKFCSDVKKGVEEEEDVCNANAANECFCLPGNVWAERGGQCIPDKLCKWMHG